MLEPSMVENSFACRPNKGSHRAVIQFVHFQRRFPYFLHLDIKNYYPTVNHAVVLDLMRPRLRDPRMMALLALILDSGWDLYRRPDVRSFFGLPVLTAETEPHGLPIGNLTSQWWGNWYLTELDHFIKRDLKVKGYLRYMDDMVCFAHSKAELKHCRKEIEAWLIRKRKLTLNHKKAHIRQACLPHVWLGYRVTPMGYDLGPKAIKRFRKRLTYQVLLPEVRLRRVLASWRGVMTF